MTVTAASEVFDSIQIYLLRLKWINNRVFVNLTLNMSKAFFMMLINVKDDLCFFFFIFLINSCKNAAILK